MCSSLESALNIIGASVCPKSWVRMGPNVFSACFKRSGAMAMRRR